MVNDPSKLYLVKKWLGLTLIVLSFIFYGGLLLVPFTPFSAGNKIVISSLLVIMGEASFWIGILILGKEAVSKYRNIDWRSMLEGFVSRGIGVMMKYVIPSLFLLAVAATAHP